MVMDETPTSGILVSGDLRKEIIFILFILIQRMKHFLVSRLSKLAQMILQYCQEC